MIAREVQQLRGNGFMQVSPDVKALFEQHFVQKPQARWDAAVQDLIEVSQ